MGIVNSQDTKEEAGSLITQISQQATQQSLIVEPQAPEPLPPAELTVKLIQSEAASTIKEYLLSLFKKLGIHAKFTLEQPRQQEIEEFNNALNANVQESFDAVKIQFGELQKRSLGGRVEELHGFLGGSAEFNKFKLKFDKFFKFTSIPSSKEQKLQVPFTIEYASSLFLEGELRYYHNPHDDIDGFILAKTIYTIELKRFSVEVSPQEVFPEIHKLTVQLLQLPLYTSSYRDIAQLSKMVTFTSASQRSMKMSGAMQYHDYSNGFQEKFQYFNIVMPSTAELQIQNRVFTDLCIVKKYYCPISMELTNKVQVIAKRITSSIPLVYTIFMDKEYVVLRADRVVLPDLDEWDDYGLQPLMSSRMKNALQAMNSSKISRYDITLQEAKPILQVLPIAIPSAGMVSNAIEHSLHKTFHDLKWSISAMGCIPARHWGFTNWCVLEAVAPVHFKAVTLKPYKIILDSCLTFQFTSDPEMSVSLGSSCNPKQSGNMKLPFNSFLAFWRLKIKDPYLRSTLGKEDKLHVMSCTFHSANTSIHMLVGGVQMSVVADFDSGNASLQSSGQKKYELEFCNDLLPMIHTRMLDAHNRCLLVDLTVVCCKE